MAEGLQSGGGDLPRSIGQSIRAAVDPEGGACDMADDIRRDYGPAGCAEGCARRSAGVLVLLLAALVVKRKRGQR